MCMKSVDILLSPSLILRHIHRFIHTFHIIHNFRKPSIYKVFRQFDCFFFHIRMI